MMTPRACQVKPPPDLSGGGRLFIKKLIEQGYDTEYVCRYCLSFIAETLINMAHNARDIYGNLPVVFVGGVMSSQVIKGIVENRMENIYFVEPVFSSDNAIGTAAIAARKVLYG